MGHGTGFDYALWAVAQDLVKRYVPSCMIWFCAMGRKTDYNSANTK
jgi:hypothetical protein